MHISRKIQRHLDAKIRHAIATGPLPHIEHPSDSEARPKPELNKDDSAGQSK